MTFIEARGDTSVSVYGAGLAMTELAVGEIGGEGFHSQGNLRVF